MIDKIKKHIRPLIDRPRYSSPKLNNKILVNKNKNTEVIQELVSGSIKNIIEDKKVKPVTKVSKKKYIKPPAKNKFKKPNPPKLPTKKDEGGVFKQLKDKLKGK